jgi:purine-binding chemotaxis protein CheW
MHDIEPSTDTAPVPRELVAFRTAGQEFCVDIMAVREIRGWTATTLLPHTPSFVQGVMNLRGAVLPIVDFAARLGLPGAEPTPRHVIVVAQVGRRQLGLLVEAVSDILTATDQDMQPPPNVASDFVRSFVRGLLVADGRLISLITLDNVLPEDDREAG